MTLNNFIDELIETINFELKINTLRYDGRFDDDNLHESIVGSETFAMVSVDNVSSTIKQSSDDTFAAIHKVEVNIYVASATITMKDKHKVDAFDICRRIMRVLFTKAPISDTTDLISAYKHIKPSTVFEIEKVSQTKSGYSVARLSTNYLFNELW
jgi:hypothetical protein